MHINGMTKRLIFEAGSIHKQRIKGVGHRFVCLLNPLFLPHHGQRFPELVVLFCPFLQLLFPTLRQTLISFRSSLYL